MASLFVRTYTFVDGTTAYGSQVESEISNIVTVLNNLNTAATNWGQVSVLHATNVPLIADCSSGSQDIADFKNASVIKASIGSDGTITIVKTSNQIVLGTTNTVTISSTAPAASRTYTMPDVGGAGTFAFLEKAQTFTAAQTLQGATGNPIHGTNTNDDASAGYIGEYISSSVVLASAVTLTNSGQFYDITNITLTAGDWDVTGIVEYTLNGATMTATTSGIGTVSGNSGTGLTAGDTRVDGLPPTSATDMTYVIPAVRKSISGSTTYYLKAVSGHSAGTPKGYGRISARRVR